MRKNKAKNKKSKRNYRNRGGSIMVPTERQKRVAAQEGGIAEEPMDMPEEPMDMPEEPMAMPPEMEATEEEVPEDTYPNATSEEIELSQKPDEAMEDDYVVFILNEALAPEEQDYLMKIVLFQKRLNLIYQIENMMYII